MFPIERKRTQGSNIIKILIGFYYGIGDFISAIPVIRHLSRNKEYKVFVAMGEQNRSLEKLVDLDNVAYLYFPLFSIKKSLEIIRLFLKLKVLDFDEIYLSPHCQDHLTSWKIPIMLKCLKGLSNRPKIVGAKGDRNAWMYDERIPIDKSLPLMPREIAFAKLASIIEIKDEVYTNNLFVIAETSKRNEIIIHPGAGRPLRKWSVEHYPELCTVLLGVDAKLNIRFIGLPKELEGIKAVVKNQRVLFEDGSLDEMVRRLCGARAVITMDSGFSHIAAALGLPHVALFGSADPEYTRPIGPYSKIIFKNELECQPCNAFYCKLRGNECMDLITTKDVMEKLRELRVF